MSHVLRKPVSAIWEQQRSRSACASMQSDQRLCCSLLRQYNIHTCYIQNFKTLASFCSWAGWFVSYPVRNPKDRFSHDEAPIYFYLLTAWSRMHCVHDCKYWLWYELWHDQTNKMSVRPAKTQISLGIRPVWSESSLSAWRKLGSLATHEAHSEDSDQSGRMPRLIWVFAGRTVTLFVLSCRGSYAMVSVLTEAGLKHLFVCCAPTYPPKLALPKRFYCHNLRSFFFKFCDRHYLQVNEIF